MLRGFATWRSEGLRQCKRVRDASLAYRKDSDVLGQWMGDVCDVGQGYSAPQRSAYLFFRQWCIDQGLRCPAKKTFTRNLKERGIGESRESSGAREHNLHRFEAQAMSRAAVAPSPIAHPSRSVPHQGLFAQSFPKRVSYAGFTAKGRLFGTGPGRIQPLPPLKGSIPMIELNSEGRPLPAATQRRIAKARSCIERCVGAPSRRTTSRPRSRPWVIVEATGRPIEQLAPALRQLGWIRLPVERSAAQ